MNTKSCSPQKPAPTPEPRTLPLVAVRVEPTRSPTVEIVKPTERGRPVQPCPVVARAVQSPPWLEQAVAPQRHPDELLALRFFMDGGYAASVGHEIAWDREVSAPLVVKLHAAASVEAKRRGQPPPPVEIVAGHTVTWYANAVAG